MRSRRGVAAAIAVVVIVATALAPLAAAALFCADLAVMPALFAAVCGAPLPQPATPRILASDHSVPLPGRAPPTA